MSASVLRKAQSANRLTFASDDGARGAALRCLRAPSRGQRQCLWLAQPCWLAADLAIRAPERRIWQSRASIGAKSPTLVQPRTEGADGLTSIVPRGTIAYRLLICQARNSAGMALFPQWCQETICFSDYCK